MDPRQPSEFVPPPVPQAPPLEYRRGGPEQKSQWWTDGDAYGAAMVYALLGLTLLGALGWALWWLVSWLLGMWLWW